MEAPRRTSSARQTRFVPVLMIVLSLLLVGVGPSYAAGPQGVVDEAQAIDPDRIGAYTGWVVDKDDDRIQDTLERKMATGAADEVVYLHLHYPWRPSQAHGDELLEDFPAEKVYVFHNFDKIKVQTRLGDVGAFTDAPGVVAISEFVPPVLENNVGSKAIRARADTTVDDGLDHANAAHTLGFKGQDQVVAVLDTGVDANHPYLDDMDQHDGTDDPKQILGVTLDNGFAVACTDPVDDNGHGTHVAGTAVGTGGGAGEDVETPGANMGAAPGAKLIDVDIGVNMGITALGLGEDIAFDWVIDYNNGDAACAEDVDHVANRIDVATMSFGSGGDNPSGSLNTGITDVVRSGVVFTSSAGNSGDSATTLTTGAEGAIIVAATNDHDTVGRSDDDLADFSSRGPRASDGDADTLDELRPDVAAPGVDIESANTFYPKEPLAPENASFSGTSMSTPFVAGVSALILQANPSLAPTDEGSNTAMGDVGAVPVRDVLQQTASFDTATNGAPPQFTDVGKFGLPWNNGWGYGLIDAYCAVQMALGTPCSGSGLSIDAAGPYAGTVGDETLVWADTSGGTEPYTWQWSIDAAPTGGSGTFGDPTEPLTTFTPDTEGTYVLEVTVTDADGTIASDTASLEATPAVPPTIHTGTLLVGNPASASAGGVTENLAPCDTSSPLNGLDGIWFDLTGTHTEFELTMEDTIDTDVWFYDAGCGFIDSSAGAQNFLGATESGLIPANAEFAIVDNFSGAGDFTLTLT